MLALLWFCAAAWPCAATFGCSAVVDADDLRYARTVRLELRNRESFLDARAEVRVLQGTDRHLVLRGVLEGLNPEPGGGLPWEVRLFSAADAWEDNFVELRVDLERDGSFDIDHVAQELRPDEDETPEWPLWVDLSVDGVSVDEPASQPRLPFTFEVYAEMEHPGAQLELVVIDEAARRSVGYAYVREYPGDGYTVQIDNIIEPDRSYAVELYFDANRNRRFDGTGADHTWIEYGTSSSSGLDMTFRHRGNFQELSAFVVSE